MRQRRIARQCSRFSVKARKRENGIRIIFIWVELSWRLDRGSAFVRLSCVS